MPPSVALRAPQGDFVMLDGEPCYRIVAYDRLEPFLMTIASDADLWMFVAAGGGLTAGRVDAEGSLFPYRTVDQLHDAHHHTGPLTLCRVARGANAPTLWLPLAGAAADTPDVERRLYKNVLGSAVVFEEIDHQRRLAFRYRWAACDRFGWVRTATLENRSDEPVRLELLDGLRNVLPYGAPLSLQQQASNLVDAYKKNEVDPATGLAIFALTAGITDRAEAVEMLRANVVWSSGLPGRQVHLSLAAVDAFRRGLELPAPSVVNGQRGHYLVSASLALEPGQTVRWHLAADVGLDHAQIVALRRRIESGDDLAAGLDEAIAAAAANLRRLVAGADGLQRTRRPESWAHHLANVLFNVMRGGVFAQNHDVPVADLLDVLARRNGEVAARHRDALAALPAMTPITVLLEHARAVGDVDLMRLVQEYLPLHFGRRHGDPSRPWNRFTIRARALHHEGNWRDIFQNWEALGLSYPAFLPGMVARFVNASTVDGFNPYRLTRDGVDWEVPQPDDPWSNIGYWGDHQVVYLLRLLEALHAHDAAAIATMLGEPIFSYAEVPYRLAPYADIVADPRATITYDAALAARIDQRVARRGTDGKLLTTSDGTVYHANLLEKLLVTALARLSNFVPDAGIWMNTQRPEWNDANNALAGGGVSVVTLCYLRRYLAFLAERCDEAGGVVLPIAAEVAAWFEQVAGILERHRASAEVGPLDDRARRRVVDGLGGAFCEYRAQVYTRGFGGRREVAAARVADACRTALAWVDRSIAANRRPDGLYHTYNLLEFSGDGGQARVVVHHLQEMLEGQVAALSSGALDPAASLDVLERLFESALYRADQRSFMLYPERDRPGFMARNAVPDDGVTTIPLLLDLLVAGERSVLVRDDDGVCRFAGDLRHAQDLDEALDALACDPAWAAAVARDRAAVQRLFEQVFRHRSYTGRSGVMYGYEGIGCIYWHMVAKLLVAAQELVLRAEREASPAPVRDGLARMYLRIRRGLGYEKSVAEYGAFPTDPYSHTPARGGAKQPGMTGQVKEEILTRFGELGVRVEGGAVSFRPVILQAAEFLREPASFAYVDVRGEDRRLELPAGSLAFTYCQVPVVYERTHAAGTSLTVHFADGRRHAQPTDTLEPALASLLAARDGQIERIVVGVPAACLR